MVYNYVAYTKHIISALKFLVGLMMVVGIHDLGHLIFAKIFKMKVESYGIGLPPKIFRYKKRETEYYLGAIPLGGSIVIKDNEEENSEKKFRDNLKRLATAFGGVLASLFSAFLIFTSMVIFLDNPSKVSSLSLSRNYSANEKCIGKEKFTCKKITSDEKFFQKNAISEAYRLFLSSIKSNISIIYNIFSGEKKLRKIFVSPIGIVRIFNDTDSIWSFLNIVSHLSIALAITNLIPLPALDGGYALIILLSIFFRRDIFKKNFFMLQKILISLLLLLSLYAVIIDVYNFF